jgi:hypothetical protein
MSKRIFTTKGLTFNAIADGILTGVNWMALKAQFGPPAQLVDVLEIKLSGMMSASTIGAFVLKRASTNETTPTALATASASDALMLPTGTALASTVTAFIAAATAPTASTAVTDASLDLGINGFGGILRWNAAPGQEWKIQANAATPGAPGVESVLFNSNVTTGAANCAANIHIIYEPY